MVLLSLAVMTIPLEKASRLLVALERRGEAAAIDEGDG
jgi:hypothetical protein